MRRVREVVERDGAAFGAWCILGNPLAGELLARAGFDWMCADCQHGRIGSIESLMPLLEVMNRHDVAAFVRIPWKTDFNFAMYALDYGAQGLIVPMIDTPAEAEAIARAVRYPPLGERSWGPVRARLELAAYDTAAGNGLVCCLPMIETARGLANLDAILAVDGVDGVYIGPADLLISQGCPPETSRHNPTLRALAERVLSACRNSGKLAGMHAASPDDAAFWAELGFQLVHVCDDAAMIEEAAAAKLQRLATLGHGSTTAERLAAAAEGAV